MTGDTSTPRSTITVFSTLTLALGTMLVTGLVTGCAPPDDDHDRLGSADAEIVNGSTDSGDPAVVALTAGGSAFCTGTLIRSNIVLTAAHCLPPHLGDFGISSFTQIDIFFGSNVGAGGTFVPVADGWTHPGWNENVFEDDIGLVRMTQAGPATPVPIATTAMTGGDSGAPVRAVGFGITQTGANNSGVKRQGNSTINQVFQFLFSIGLNPSITCSGDSGGPTFMTRNGSEVVAGIHSRSDCETEAFDTRVDDYNTEILNFIGEAPPDPECTADGQCATNCGAPDPDCPCAADTFCTDACGDPASDPDCPTQANCDTDGFCNPECATGVDLDCESIDPPTDPPDSWYAGDAPDEAYGGSEVVSSCSVSSARSERGSKSPTALTWLAALGLAALVRRRRPADERHSRS